MKIKIEKEIRLKEVRNFFFFATLGGLFMLLGVLLVDIEHGWDLMFWKYNGKIIEGIFYTTVGFFVLSVLLWIVLSIRKKEQSGWKIWKLNKLQVKPCN